jgi:very-short-patch-repair endonuclease
MDIVITNERAKALGYGDALIRRQLRNGLWICLARGIYQTRPPASEDERIALLLRAKLLQCGEDAVLSHESAALLYAFDTVTPLIAPQTIDDVCVSVSGQTATRLANVRRTKRPPATDVTLVNLSGMKIRITTKERTLLDLAATLSLDEWEMALESALRGVDPRRPYEWNHQLLANLQMRGNFVFRGAPIVRGALGRRPAHASPTASGGETLAVQLFRSAGLPVFRRQVSVRIIGRNGSVKYTFFPDFADIGRGLIIEIDGIDAHANAAALTRDLRRQNELVRAFEMVRFTGTQIRSEPERVIARIRESLDRLSPSRLASMAGVRIHENGIDLAAA